TGEDGFELYLPADRTAEIWRLLLEKGAAQGLVPAGLGARDTLRLEASMALYGHEIDATTTPWEAGLDWTVKLDKGDFVGKAALVAQREQGVTRRLVGFEMRDRGIGREGYPILDGDTEIGRVTSGTFSPTLDRALGMAYVPVEKAEPGTPLTVGIRGRGVAAEVVATPFYRRPK
ncbi:MAG: glycine cleavage system aminomethyltransferase GcvT, partial [Acidobacteria bacterium]|nr:glycine cleavage system aminomethyltransferase GcvT [Acidobacteriota bacterium]